jgi:hypothetical protein
MTTSPHAERLARFRRACWWLSLGVALLPLKPCSKHLQPGFGPRKARISDVSCARKWFLHTDANLGVLLGPPSGLIVADWDDQAAYLRWRATDGAAVATLAERTPRGVHLFFFAPPLRSAAGEGCELKTRGACAVAPSIHPSGRRYRTLHAAPIAALDAALAGVLFPFLSDRVAPRPSRDARRCRGATPAGRVDRIKAARSTLAEMHDAGVILVPGGPNTLVGCCPFHDDHAPSLWLYPDSGVWGCNRPDCRAARVHDVINFRAFWRRISNRAAIGQLADEFL